MDVQNQWRLFWFGKYLETVLVLSILAVGALFVLAGFMNPQMTIQCWVMAALWLVWAWAIDEVTKQPKDKF
jgi:hypothetical protein